MPFLPLPQTLSSLIRRASNPVLRARVACGLVAWASLAVIVLSPVPSSAVDEAAAGGSGVQQTVTEGTYSLPTTVDYEGRSYQLTGRPLSTEQMKLMMPGVTWVYYREDGTTQWEYHTFDGYVLRWNENSTVVVAGAWQIIDNRICWTYNGPFCRRIWNTEREDLFAIPVGPERPLMPARFEIGDPLGLANRNVIWLVTQSQDARDRTPLNPVQPDVAPQANPDQAERDGDPAIDEQGAPQLFTPE